MDKINYTAIVDDIEEILLDPCELDIRIEESRDEDGVHLWKEVASSDKQREQVKELLRQFLIKEMQTLINNIFATEDAKRIHYE